MTRSAINPGPRIEGPHLHSRPFENIGSRLRDAGSIGRQSGIQYQISPRRKDGPVCGWPRKKENNRLGRTFRYTF